MLLADATLFAVIDTYPIELLFSIREGRDKRGTPQCELWTKSEVG